MGIAEDIHKEILELISDVKTCDPKNGSNKPAAKVQVINHVASKLKTLFKNNAQIKLENKDLAKALKRQTGCTKIEKTIDFDKSMSLLNTYINDYKEILEPYTDYKDVILHLTALQNQLTLAKKRLEA